MIRNILVISNGRGEDSISVTILDKLKAIGLQEGYASKLNIVVLPLVDDGSYYKSKGYETAATWKTLPSKGFVASSVVNLFKDIRYGLIDIFKKQALVIRKEAANADLIVTMGDIVPLLFACLWAKGKHILHVGTAISAYIRSYSLLEIWLFKKYTSCVVCRDKKTMQQLTQSGVNAVFYGNPMMDDPMLKKAGVDLGVETKKKNIVLVPSSREDAYDNTVRMLNLIKKMGKLSSYAFILSLAPNLNVELLKKKIAEVGWSYDEVLNSKKPLIANLRTEDANEVQVVRGYFRDCLDEASAVFGMTGTGNEQIAGLGIPLILLQGKSDAASAKRMEHYKKLLGNSVFVPTGKDSKIVDQIKTLLSSQRTMEKMAATGKDRMGEPGGAEQIARKILFWAFQ